jgi:HSP20 family protein
VTVIRFDPFGDPFRQLDRLTSQLLSGTRTPMGMAMDVWQADDGYHAALDLPGVVRGWTHRAWRLHPSETC